ncbi:protein kinase domain-containing protein [Microbispora sp. KK1-11]|uniref:protein kinase domain-containing protein n=1 Tax=Microbispora sp. KK1-11 TaxID=2053005 RepID=UPI001157E6CB|nr:protein kinase [Microbispora sp. KK1-11]TQS27841.1 protein kinase [Microbispora sp. KK1-11]
MTTDAPMARPGRVIRDRYELRSQLGRGGMGTVWLAMDRMLGRLVALKEVVLTPYGEGLEVQRARALREARSLARIRHPAIAEIYDVFEEGGSPWIVMVYVEGGSLDDLIRRRTLPEREIAAVGRDVLAGLTAAHAAHVLHRDVKPANIVVGHGGKVVLVDFGIAQIVGESGLTSHSIMLGTTEFMAPERIDGRTAGPAADLWSLGVTFFCALEGYSPFRRDNAYATVHAVCTDDLPPPRRRGPLYDVIAGLLRKDPALRMGAAELDRRLAAIAAPPPPRPPVERPRSRPPQPLPALDASSLRGAAAAVAAMAPGAAGQALEAMAGDPSRAAGVLALLPSGQAGRVVGHMTAGGAAALLRQLPASRGAGILAEVPDRVAADILNALGVTPAAVRLVEAMTTRRARQVLEYVPPPITAALLRATTDGRAERLLAGLSPAVRAQIAIAD